MPSRTERAFPVHRPPVETPERIRQGERRRGNDEEHGSGKAPFERSDVQQHEAQSARARALRRTSSKASWSAREAGGQLCLIAPMPKLDLHRRGRRSRHRSRDVRAALNGSCKSASPVAAGGELGGKVPPRLTVLQRCQRDADHVGRDAERRADGQKALGPAFGRCGRLRRRCDGGLAHLAFTSLTTPPGAIVAAHALRSVKAPSRMQAPTTKT